MAKVDSTSCFYVYVHRRATDGRVFYVGKGKGRRAYEKGHRNPHWQKTVAKHGYVVEIVQDNMQEWWAFDMERELIALYGRENLTNYTDGGDGPSGYKPTEESKKAASLRYKGRKLSDDTRKKMSDSQKNRKHSDQTKKKMSEIAKNRTAEHLLKISVAQIGKFVSKETREKIGTKHKGTKHTEAHKQFISNALKKSCKKIPIVCVENNMHFPSMKDAALWLQSNEKPKACGSGIYYALKKTGRIAYGFTWKYA